MIDVSLDRDRLVGLLSMRAVGPAPFTEADWQRLVDLAVKHRLAPFLHAKLLERGLAPPPAAADQLQRAHLVNAVRNTGLLHVLDNILRACHDGGVAVTLLKGVHFAEAVYDDIALRHIGDVDLWVSRGQLEAARAVMRSLGYVSRSRTKRPQALQDALTGETQLFKANAPMVELHWNIFAGEWFRHTARIDEQLVWQRTESIEGSTARRLSHEDAIIHLCLHLAINHQMSEAGLRTLVDLDVARRTWTIDWDVVVQRARAWRVSCALWLVLQRLVEIFGDPSGEIPVVELAPSRLRQTVFTQLVSARFLVEGAKLTGGPGRFLFMLAAVDRPTDAGRLLWRGFFPDRLWLTLRYELQNAPAWRVWLQRLWHPVRVAFRRDI